MIVRVFHTAMGRAQMCRRRWPHAVLVARQVYQHRVAGGFGLIESFKGRAGDPDRATAFLAIADVRLDTADGLLSYAAYQGLGPITGWENTISDAFRASSVLCARFQEVQTSYANAKIVPIARLASKER